MAAGNVLIKNYTKQMKSERKADLNEALILSLIPSVKRIAIRVKNRIYSDHTIDDLFSIAMVALIESASKVDDSDTEKYKHYLLKRAKGAIYDELRKEDHLSRSSRDFLDTYKKALDVLNDSLDRNPTHQELAEYLEITEDELVEELRKTETQGFFSLQEWFSQEDGTNNFDDLVAGDSDVGEDKVGDLDIQTEILKYLDKLSFQERLVLSFYYYDELSFKEIALVMNVSIGRISQLHTKAIENLKAMIKFTPKEKSWG